MKPHSKAESLWRTLGKEARKWWQQGSGAAKTARNFTRKQSNKAMRHNDKTMISEGME